MEKAHQLLTYILSWPPSSGTGASWPQRRLSQSRAAWSSPEPPSRGTDAGMATWPECYISHPPLPTQSQQMMSFTIQQLRCLHSWTNRHDAGWVQVALSSSVPGLSLANSWMVSSDVDESLETSGLLRCTLAPQAFATFSISSWSVDTHTLRKWRRVITNIVSFSSLNYERNQSLRPQHFQLKLDHNTNCCGRLISKEINASIYTTAFESDPSRTCNYLLVRFINQWSCN